MDNCFFNQTLIRQANKNDANFLLNSWLRSCRGSPNFKYCPDRLFFQKLSNLITHLLTVKDCVVICPTECHEQILAWMCYERIEEPVINTVYFCYTKKPYRELGAQRWLFGQILGDEPIQYCMPTSLGHKIAPKLNAIYNPFVIMR